jgi:hypothetical protein
MACIMTGPDNSKWMPTRTGVPRRFQLPQVCTVCPQLFALD